MTAAAEIPSTYDTGSVRPKVLVEFRKHSGSTLGGFFGAAAFDEVALVPVAAAVDKTGRFASNFADRGVRSGFRPCSPSGAMRPTRSPRPIGSR